ncbi:MAG: CARDB domain-containing protein, partial [Myxococcota bacterium]
IGNYYWGAIADYSAAIAEGNETNNAMTGNAVAVNGPDLVVTAVSGPTMPQRGTFQSFSVTIKNQGPVNISRIFYTGFYLSTDPVITTSDRYIGYTYMSSLAAGASYTQGLGTTISTAVPYGTYYVGAIVDFTNVVPEMNETNNTRVGNTLQLISGADMLLTAVSGPTTALRGTYVTVSTTPKNQGTGATPGSYYVGIYLSTDNVITPSDIYLGNYTVSQAAGASTTVSTSVRIPPTQAAGTYYIGAYADYPLLVVEPNETNNGLAGNAINVTQ